MAAALRLRGQTVGEVAAALHVAPSTVRRWEADERFQQEIDRQLALLPRIVPNAPAGRLGVAKGSAATAPDPATFARRQPSVPHREAPQKPHNSSKDDHLEDLECEALIDAILSRR